MTEISTKKIKKAMIDNDISSLKELSRISDVNISFLSYLMNNNIFMDLHCICKALNLKLEDIIN